MKAMIWTIATIIGLVVSAIWSGFVLTRLWLWFVVSQFADMPQLHLAGAIGLAIIISFLTKDRDERIEDRRSNEDKIYAIVGEAIFRPLLALVIGYIVHLFM